MSDSTPVSRAVRERLTPLVEESQERLGVLDHGWFARKLPQREHWRTLPNFRGRIGFLDIETTGGYGPNDLTVVGLYDGIRLTQYMRGENLEELPDALERIALLVTFFGTGFDLPFLRNVFHLELPQLHIDLCFLLKRLGYKGGLKSVERQIGIRRSEGTEGLEGWDAVRLWWEWQAGDDRALSRLLAYNAEDVLNMERLLDIAFPLIREQTFSSG